MSYHLRNDWVLIKITKLDKVNGLVMPDACLEGKIFTVEAKGPDVVDLEVGDKVLMGGSPEKEGAQLYFPMPGKRDLLVIQQKFVILSIKPDLVEGK